MSMMCRGLVQPAAGYCSWHQLYDYDHLAPLVARPLSHVDTAHYPFVGGHWFGMHVYENCRHCAQPFVATSDPRVNFCQNCGAYQWHHVSRGSIGISRTGMECHTIMRNAKRTSAAYRLWRTQTGNSVTMWLHSDEVGKRGRLSGDARHPHLGKGLIVMGLFCVLRLGAVDVAASAPLFYRC